MNVKESLKHAVSRALSHFSPEQVDVAIQETPSGKAGDYGTPVAFVLAKALRKNPAQIAAELAQHITLPEGIAKVECVGPYINFFVDSAAFVRATVEGDFKPEPKAGKVIVEHTSVNPNKELHVGHVRNVCLGDAIARIFKAGGYTVEVQNYIDDTGRQAAESIFAKEHYNEPYNVEQKYDHWLGELYVRLNADTGKSELEPGIRAVIHDLEAGKLRAEIEEVLHAQLQTCYALGAEYDLLTWESDIVHSGFLDKAMKILAQSSYCSYPTEGKYAGCFVMDVSEFIQGMEDPILVLIRSDGTATYTAKDIALQFWKVGLFTGLTYQEFESQPSGKPLYTSHPHGKEGSFAGASRVVNVIDDRQTFPQTVVRTALAIAGYPEQYQNSQHLSYATVLLEGQTISGRKGITVSADEVIREAIQRAHDISFDQSQTSASPIALSSIQTAEDMKKEALILSNIFLSNINNNTGLQIINLINLLAPLDFSNKDNKSQHDFKYFMITHEKKDLKSYGLVFTEVLRVFEQRYAVDAVRFNLEISRKPIMENLLFMMIEHLKNTFCIGLGAMRFALLKSEPTKQIDFKWDSALALNGDTAPYVLFATVRAANILRKAEEAGVSYHNPDYALVTPLEVELMKTVARYPEMLAVAIRDCSPHHMVQYALDLATVFNSYYNHKDDNGKPDTRVIDAPEGLREARMCVVRKVKQTLEQVLETLGIGIPSEM